MFSLAISLAIVTFATFYILYRKLPQKIRDFIPAHPLIFDALAAGATYAFLGGTITALLAGGIVALMTSGALHIANHKEDFLYLYDGVAAGKRLLNAISERLSEIGKQYRLRESHAIA